MFEIFLVSEIEELQTEIFENRELVADKHDWMCKYEQEKFNLATELTKNQELANDLQQKGKFYQF